MSRDHFRKAERLIEQAESWDDADHGWKASLSSRERIERSQRDYLGAIAHALLGVGEALGGVPIPVLDLPARTDTPKETTP